MNDLTDAQKIYEQWHEFAKNGNVEALMNLYAPDAILETPLTMAILEDATSGVLRGAEMRRFFTEGVQRRPNALVRWYRDGTYFWNGHRLVWEYPRQMPDGEQVDIMEVMDISAGKITHHRIYWGWFGFELLKQSFLKKAKKNLLLGVRIGPPASRSLEFLCLSSYTYINELEQIFWYPDP
jgi:hypothetical protein